MKEKEPITKFNNAEDLKAYLTSIVNKAYETQAEPAADVAERSPDLAAAAIDAQTTTQSATKTDEEQQITITVSAAAKEQETV